MKKLLMLLVAAIIMMPTALDAANNSKDLKKAIKKERKERLKAYKKGGWEVLGSTRTLDVAVLSHFQKLDDLGDNAREVVGIATRCKSKNVGQQMAKQNACINYAQTNGGKIEGMVITEIVGEGAMAEDEAENLYATYSRQVEKEIKGEMQESYTLIRDNGDGTYEVQTVYIVNEESAAKARKRALESALKESRAKMKK